MISYRGITRIGEVLRARRLHLKLPEDLLDFTRRKVYLEIVDPKTKRRGARVQHASFSDELESSYLV